MKSITHRTLLEHTLWAVAFALVAFVLSKVGGEAEGGPTTTTPPDTSPLVTAGAPARPERVRIEATDAGGQRITWSVPGRQDDDTFQVFFTDGPGELIEESTVVPDTELRIDTDQRVCVTVETVREGRVSPASTEACSP